MGAESNNRVEIRVVGMSRSGNHCIINWILQHVQGSYCFLNCAEGKTNPFLTARPMDDGLSIRSNIPELELRQEQSGRFVQKDYLIHSYEDSFLAHACSREFDENHDRLVGRSRRRIDLLVLRDAFNLFASRARLGTELPDRTALRIWKQHAKAVIHGSAHLRQSTVPVSFNRFVRSHRYRREVALRLGLGFSDRGLGEVARCAGGSSFDGTAFDGQAWRMPVLERWKSYAGDPAYRALFDREAADLTRRIFPDPELPHGEPWTGAARGRPADADSQDRRASIAPIPAQ